MRQVRSCTTSRTILGGLALLLSACAPELRASPTHASLTGQVPVTFSGDFSRLGTVQAVTVGGIRAYDLEVGKDQVTGTIQGAPRPGAVEVVITGTGGSLKAPAAFTYDPPAPGVPLTWVAFGASLTQGTQSKGITARSQINGVSGQIARAAGVYLGLPLFSPSFIVPLEPSDFDQSCHPKAAGADFQAMMKAITDPDTGALDLRRARVDPTLRPIRNVAIGGSKVQATLHGDEIAQAFLAHVVEEPESDPNRMFEPLDKTQLDRVEEMDPDVGFSTDLLANDTDPAVAQPDDVKPELVTPPEKLRPLFDELASRLGRLHGQYFIANMPSLTFVPNVIELRERRIAAGTDTAESFQAKVTRIDELTNEINIELAAALAPYPNLHLVNFHDQVDDILKNGVTIGGERLTIGRFGGLVSLDDLHFTDTGYALLANLFIDAMNPVLGSKIPRIDEAAVLAADPLSPARLRPFGFSCLMPDR